MFKSKLVPTILLTTLVVSITLNINIAFSQDIPLLFVDPPIVEDIPPSQNFSISVKIANITGLYGFDIEFRWDPTVLDYVSHVAKIPVEDHPGGVLHGPILLVVDKANATAGTYHLACSSMAIPPPPSFNGSGTIFEMTFHVKTIGRCPLEIYISDLSDKDGKAILHDVEHGYFTNVVAQPAKISVEPKRVIDADLTPCKNFTVDVNLEDLLDLEAFEFWLGYNTTILDVAEVAVNPIFPPPVEIEIFEPEGQIRVAASTSPPISGDLSLASITFHVTDTGESVLDLHNITLVDSFGELIPYEEPVDGFFSNILKAKLYVDPAEIIDPTLTPGSEFNININMEDVIDLYSYEFNLTYDTGILTCLGAVIIPPTNDTNFITEISMVDENGYILINVTYYPPAEPITILPPTTIAAIYFQVQSYGCTVLDLHDTKIINQYGGTIPHDVGDGFFCTLIRDVAILSVEPSSNLVYPGRIVNITVVAANIGNITETFNVTTYYDNNTIATQTVSDLPPNKNITLIFTWDTTGLEPCNNYTIKAEASPVQHEHNLENNIYDDAFVKIKMLGDVNGDGIIDIYDVVAVASIYGSKEGDPDWDPEADVAPQYGVIDIYDVVTVAAKYGQTC